MFEIHCSSGTYIRSLCRDMAVFLSTCGVMSDIIRTRCGFLKLEDSNSLEEIKDGKFKIIPMEDLFFEEKLSLSEEESFKVMNGVKINVNACDGIYKIFTWLNEFIGLGEIKAGKLKITLRLI